MPVSHDSANRFLLREDCAPADLFNEIKGRIVLENGAVSADDTVIEKPYMTPSLNNLTGWFRSGKHKCTVKGLNLIIPIAISFLSFIQRWKKQPML